MANCYNLFSIFRFQPVFSHSIFSFILCIPRQNHHPPGEMTAPETGETATPHRLQSVRQMRHSPPVNSRAMPRTLKSLHDAGSVPHAGHVPLGHFLFLAATQTAPWHQRASGTEFLPRHPVDRGERGGNSWEKGGPGMYARRDSISGTFDPKCNQTRQRSHPRQLCTKHV